MGAMFDYLDAEEGGAEDRIKNALAEVIELNKKIRGSPDGSEKTELAARAGLQGATVLLYVYGHAHDQERDWWDRRSCREMFTTVEKLVEEEVLVEAYKIMCTDPQLKCGVFCEEHRRHKFTVDFYVKNSCPHQTYVEKDGLGALFSVRQVLAAAADTLRQKVVWFKKNFPEDEEDPADGLPFLSLGVKIPNRQSWQDVCTSEDADGSAAKSSSRAQLYAFVNPGVLEKKSVQVRIGLAETLFCFKKRRPAVETAEKGEERPAKKKPKSAKLVETCKDASCGDTEIKKKAFKAMADLYLDPDVRQSYESRLDLMHKKFEEILVRIALPDFRKKYPRVVSWDDFPRMGVFGAAKDWIDADQTGAAVISFSVFCSPRALSLCMCVCARSVCVCVCARSLYVRALSLCMCVCARSVCVCARALCVCVRARSLSLYVCVRALSVCVCVCARSVCVCARARLSERASTRV